MARNFFKTVVFPDTETTEYFKAVFANCPFDIDFDSFHVVLNESASEPVSLNPNAVYIATAGTLGYWYDDNTASTQLILPLISDSILTRMAQLRINDGSVFHPSPLAFLVITPYMPPLTAAHRNFVLSCSEMLATTGHPLLFTGEISAYESSEHIPNELYYEDVLK